MIARNPYTIKTSNVSAVSGTIDSGTLASTTYNIGYYDDTKVWNAIDEIEEQVDGIERDYAKKTEIPSLDGYATENWVENQGYITSGDVSAMSYITMNDVSACGYLTEIPSEYITENELDAAAYVTALSDSQMNELFPIEN